MMQWSLIFLILRSLRVISLKQIESKNIYSIIPLLQVLDKNNETFFFDIKLEKTESVDLFFGFCGTVPHYELRVIEEEDNLIVMENETFYDNGNQEPAISIATISKNIADRIHFINGKNAFNFTSNYGLDAVIRTDPRQIVFIKNNKYGIFGVNETAIYDQITFSGGLLKIELNGLYGYYSINEEPKYKELGGFNYYLARFELPNGRKGYIDSNGNEYFDK